MDTQAEYEAGKSIISELTVDEWNEFRARKCIWPEEKLEWKRCRNFDISELKKLRYILKEDAYHEKLLLGNVPTLSISFPIMDRYNIFI